KELIFDFTNLKYIASAGLRVLLTAQKRMNKQGKMKIRNVEDGVMEVFEMTGFADLMDIEK
ncbi:MAG: STAS domain-containing protein, partial [Selenomonadaceae bacterium]|nr:STAS domain-containing protein [Selenomonadaceae bacterium]